MNIKDYIKIENLIGVGCSRAVYKANNKVIKPIILRLFTNKGWEMVLWHSSRKI